MENLWVIILAAGKGERMGGNINKVSLPLAGEPIIKRTINILKSSGIKNMVVLVGYAKESVITHLEPDIKTVEQIEQLGTAHAVQTALSAVPEYVKDILVLYGDNSYLLNQALLSKLCFTHQQTSAQITLLTSDSINPEGIGRIIRDQDNQVTQIVEQKDATPNQLQTREINLGIYIFDHKFLKDNLSKVKKSPITNEYYLTDLVKIARKQNLKVVALKIKDIKWRGINTPKELEEAEKLIQS